LAFCTESIGPRTPNPAGIVYRFDALRIFALVHYVPDPKRTIRPLRVSGIMEERVSDFGRGANQTLLLREPSARPSEIRTGRLLTSALHAKN